MTIRLFGAVALIAVAPVLAATPINETRALSVQGKVSIENVKGRIVVRTWSKPQVLITGSLGEGVEKLRITGDRQSLDIEVKYPDGGAWNLFGKRGRNIENTVLVVTIPRTASLEIGSVSASVDVAQMAGSELEVSSVSGDVSVTASSPGEASFDNVSGNTTLRLTSRKVEANSVSGDVSLRGGLDGEVSMESVSGDLKLTAGALKRLDVSTVSGDAHLQAGVQAAGSIRAETLSGDLLLRLPATTGARLHAESFSGDLSSPSAKVRREEHGPGKSLDARYGDGKASVRLESFSGDVTVQMD